MSIRKQSGRQSHYIGARSMALLRSNSLHAKIAKVMVSLVFGAIFALSLTPWQQTAAGSGRVVAYSPTDRQQNIDAPVDGRLGQWFVHESSHVREGDSIVELIDNDPEILSRLRSEREAISLRLGAAQQATRTSKLNVARQKNLFEQGISSKRAYEQAELEYARFLSDEATSAAELSRIEVRLSRQETQSVRAPRSGTILKRMAGQGSKLVKAGEVLAVLVPDTDSRAVELWIHGNDAPLVSAGRHVRVQFEGWPAVQFSGWPAVAVGTFGGKVAFVDAADDGEGRFRVVIVPEQGESWPDSRYLRQGVRVKGWISLSRVSLGYELWRQFNGFPPSIADPAESKAESSTK